MAISRSVVFTVGASPPDGNLATNTDELTVDEVAWLRGGPVYDLGLRLGLVHPEKYGRIRRVLLLTLVTWLPLLVLTSIAGTALGHRVTLPLLRDPEIYIRFLFVVPLLELAEVIVAVSLAVQVRHFVESGIVPATARPQYDSIKFEIRRLRSSFIAEVLIVVLSITIPVVSRVLVEFDVRSSSWERPDEALSLAGWWYALVSLPILFFFLLRWCWVFMVWSWFLFRVSRLDLQLTATHPDRAGGLGFLAWGLTCFATVQMAVSAILSGALAHEILHHGASLDSLKYHLLVFVALAVFVLHAPLLAFNGRLSRCRFTALLEFGTLVWGHDRAFDQKWMKAEGPKGAGLLGSPEVMSLAAIGAAYEHVERMRLLPLNEKALLVSVVAVVLPVLPLVATQLPLGEIISKLGEFML